jgi:hypothetical protein
MVGMFASTGELELAVLGLASLLSLTGILEAIVASSSSAHTRVVEMTSDRGLPASPDRVSIYQRTSR